MSETLDTWVAIIAMLLITGRWLYLEVRYDSCETIQTLENFDYAMRIQWLTDKLNDKKTEATTLKAKNKCLQEEINKIKEITNKWT